MESERYIERKRPLCCLTDWQADKETREKRSRNFERMSVGVTRSSSQYRTVAEGFEDFKLRANNELLKERNHEIEFICHKMELTLPDIVNQLNILLDMKDTIQAFIAEVLPLSETSNEVMSLMDRQREIDRVVDDAYETVKAEVEEITKIRNTLTNDISQYFPMVLKLTRHKNNLVDDLKCKNGVLDIQRHILKLSPFSGDASFKPWPEDSPLMADERTWLQSCCKRIKAAREDIEPAIKLVSDSKNLMTTLQNEIKKCRENTEHSLHLKIQQLIMTRDSLIRQRRTLLKQVDALQVENRHLELSRNQNRYRAKFAETKLEWLKFRPSTDLVQDRSHEGLLEENEQLKQLNYELDVPTQDSTTVLNDIYDHIDDVEKDLMRKENSLMIEMTCLDLHSNPPKCAYQSDISWLHDLSKYSKLISEKIQRHINARELAHRDPVTNICNEKDEIHGLLQKLSLTTSELNRLADIEK